MTKVALYVAGAAAARPRAGRRSRSWWGVPLLVLGAARRCSARCAPTSRTTPRPCSPARPSRMSGFVAIGLGPGAGLPRRRPRRAGGAGGGGGAAARAEPRGLQDPAVPRLPARWLHGAGSRAAGPARRADPRHAARPPAARWSARGAAASLPPLSGFASEWLLLQSLLAGWRVGDIGFQVLAAAAAALAAHGGGAGGGGDGAAVRPGLPRPAAHARAAPGRRTGSPPRALALLLPAGLTVLLGAVPGPAAGAGRPGACACWPARRRQAPARGAWRSRVGRGRLAPTGRSASRCCWRGAGGGVWWLLRGRRPRRRRRCAARPGIAASSPRRRTCPSATR